MNNIIKRKWNQNSMVIIEDLQGMAFQDESGGHTFQISGIDGEGNTVALSGTPAGVMLRSDGQDVTLTCSVSGGVVSATLPANAYSVPGRFGLTIFLTSDGQKTAIYAAVGTVGKTSSGTVAPPAGSDVVTLVNAIATAVATIPASYTDLMASVAPTYSSSGLYAVGSYAWYNGKLYRCTTAITSGETWTSGHWTLANLGSDLVDLKSALKSVITAEIDETDIHYGNNLYNKFTSMPYTLLNGTTGAEEYSVANDASDFIPFTDGYVTVRDFTNYDAYYVHRVYFYNASKEFIERKVSNTGAIKFSTSTPTGTAYIRICMPHTSLENQQYSIEEGQKPLDDYEPYYTAYDKEARINAERNGAKISEIRTESGKNLFNWETLKSNVLLNTSTGVEEFSVANDSSDYIPVNSAKVTIRDFVNAGGAYVYRMYFYTSAKEFIERKVSNSGATQYTFTCPNNTAYIRISIPHANIVTARIVIVEGEGIIINNYVPFFTAYDGSARETVNKINTDAVTESNCNLYNWTTTKQNILLNGSTGVEEYSAVNDSSDYIPFTASNGTVKDFVNAGGVYVYRVYFYTSAKEFIERKVSSTGAAQFAFACPQNTAYIRVCIPHADPSTHKYMVLVGSNYTIKKYVPYYSASDEVARHCFTKPAPMLTIIDDDGHEDYKTYLLPFCKSVNTPIATAITTLRVGGQSGVGRYMTWEEIIECIEAGAEAICHTYTHTPDNADVRKTAVVDGTYVNSTTFNDENGQAVTGETDITYHDTTTNKYYTFASGTFSEIINITIADYQKLIDVYTDVSDYYDSQGNPIYPTKDAYYTDKLAKYYNIAKQSLQRIGAGSASILACNNSTGAEQISQDAAQRVFRCCMDYHTDKINLFGQINRNNVSRTALEPHRYNVDWMKSQIDTLIESGGWQIWVMHTTGEEWRGTQVSPGVMGIGKDAVMANLKEAFDYAHSKGVKIVTASYGCSAYIDGMA